MTDSAVFVLLDTVKAQGVPYYIEREDSHAPKFDAKAKEELDKTIQALEQYVAEGGR